MIGCTLAIQINGVGLLKGVLIRDTKDFMVIRGEDKKVTNVLKKWITMFQVVDKNPKPIVNVFGVKKDGVDTGIRFFRVGQKKKGDEKALLDSVSMDGEVFHLGELSELSIEDLQSSLDGMITGE